MVFPLALLAAGARAGDTAAPDVDWASQEITLSALQTWGTRHYRFSAREPGGKETAEIGVVSLATEVTDDAIILKDKFEIIDGGGNLTLEMTHTCRKDNFLSPTKIESKGEGSDEFATFVATVAGGKATVQAQDGRRTVCELPEGTITTAAMMRLVTLVPRTPGASYAYKYSLESEEMNLKKDYRLTVLQPETIATGDGPVECSKLRLTGGGINPVYYWVTKDGVLQRLVMDDRKVMECVLRR